MNPIIQNYVDLLLKDIRQVINAPYYAQVAQTVDPNIDVADSSGTNFVASLCAIMGIESFVRLASGGWNKPADEYVEKFLYSTNYFPRAYAEATATLWSVIRDGHAHQFRPMLYEVGDVYISAQIGWIGGRRSIETIEGDMKVQDSDVTRVNEGSHLRYKDSIEDFDSEKRRVIRLVFLPQIAYVHLKWAFDKWLKEGHYIDQPIESIKSVRVKTRILNHLRSQEITIP
ncbi:MAG: hypothetical protein O3A46_16695 [Candidatus Poribacteria bacterium]|nr:hypothetical protein [Candidatus Poribacteria bacterium]